MCKYKRIFAKPCKYKNIVFRSHLERDFAKYMDKNKIKWEYEKYKIELLPSQEYYDAIDNKIHTLRNVIIVPDFYLKEFDLLVEVKGYPYDDRLFKLKMKLFKYKYPKRKILVIKGYSQFYKLKDAIENLKEKENEI